MLHSMREVSQYMDHLAEALSDYRRAAELAPGWQVRRGGFVCIHANVLQRTCVYDVRIALQAPQAMGAELQDFISGAY